MRYTDEWMDSLRMEGDALPDRILGELFTDSQIDEVNALLRQLILNEQSYPEALPDNVEYWPKDTAQCPEWVDWERMRSASRLFREHGAMALLLSTSSLVYCYSPRPPLGKSSIHRTPGFGMLSYTNR